MPQTRAKCRPTATCTPTNDRSSVAGVGIDTLNIDSTAGSERPVRALLLGSEIPIVDHLVNLDQLPASGFSFTAVPTKIVGASTFTVRAFAAV